MNPGNAQPGILQRLFERVFPKMPDFFTLLTEQCAQVAHTAGLLVEYMETGDQNTGEQIRREVAPVQSATAAPAPLAA